MSMITFQCHACNQVLKVGAQNAGKRARCTKCGTPLTIPAPPPPEAIMPAPTPVLRQAPPPVEELEEVAPTKRRRRADDDERPRRRPRDDDDDDLEERVSRPSAGKPDWAKVRVGLMLGFIALIILLAGYGIEQIGMLIQSIASLANSFSLGLARTVRVFIQIGLVIMFCGLILAIVGFSFNLFVKSNKHGKLGFAIATLATASVGLIMFFILRLLPAFEGIVVATGTWGRVLILILGAGVYATSYLMQAFFLRGVAQTLKERAATGVLPIVFGCILVGYSILAPLLVRILIESGGFGRGAQVMFILLHWTGVPIMVMTLVLLLLRTWRLKKVLDYELK